MINSNVILDKLWNYQPTHLPDSFVFKLNKITE